MDYEKTIDFIIMWLYLSVNEGRTYNLGRVLDCISEKDKEFIDRFAKEWGELHGTKETNKR